MSGRDHWARLHVERYYNHLQLEVRSRPSSRFSCVCVCVCVGESVRAGAHTEDETHHQSHRFNSRHQLASRLSFRLRHRRRTWKPYRRRSCLPSSLKMHVSWIDSMTIIFRDTKLMTSSMLSSLDGDVRFSNIDGPCRTRPAPAPVPASTGIFTAWLGLARWMGMWVQSLHRSSRWDDDDDGDHTRRQQHPALVVGEIHPMGPGHHVISTNHVIHTHHVISAGPSSGLDIFSIIDHRCALIYGR